jgi:hypothetical protein
MNATATRIQLPLRQSVILRARDLRPPQRSNDGQTIFGSIRANLQTGLDLDLRVELRGFEPRTSLHAMGNADVQCPQMTVRDNPCGSMPYRPRNGMTVSPRSKRS